MTRSKDNAAETLAQIWTSSSTQYPPTVYGSGVRVRVIVKSISVSPRLVVTRRSRTCSHYQIPEEKGRETAARSFVVTVGYAFSPKETPSSRKFGKIRSASQSCLVPD